MRSVLGENSSENCSENCRENCSENCSENCIENQKDILCSVTFPQKWCRLVWVKKSSYEHDQ